LVSGAVARTLSTVVGTRVGQLLVTGMDTVLGKSEQLVDRYLPRTEEELGECPPCCHRHHLPNLGVQTPPGIPTPLLGVLLVHLGRAQPPVAVPGQRGHCETVQGTAATAGSQVAQGTEVGTVDTEVAPGTEVAPAGPEVALAERQRRWQSCFVRVGSLSAKLRHRALRR
ncbi:PLIN3 protein, partial [Cephalopterus ornatus]|nr:PLIN3 protein [Cephalopterus ornatus]